MERTKFLTTLGTVGAAVLAAPAVLARPPSNSKDPKNPGGGDDKHRDQHGPGGGDDKNHEKNHRCEKELDEAERECEKAREKLEEVECGCQGLKDRALQELQQAKQTIAQARQFVQSHKNNAD